MAMTSGHKNRRVLIVDDNKNILSDFCAVLRAREEVDGIDALESSIFSSAAESSAVPRPAFELSFAQQGEEALELVRDALHKGQPFALAFVDVRMPPGLDGIETLRRMWQLDPKLQAVICSAYADYSWEDITQRLGQTGGLLILRKPFDPVEVLQIASALTEKWNQEAELAEARRGLEMQVDAVTALMNAIPDMILRIDAAGRCVDCNKASASFLAAGAAPLVGKRVQDLFPEDIAAALMGRVEVVLAGEAGQVVEYTREVDGQTAYCEARLSSSGRGDAVVIVRDVSEQRRLEMERRLDEEKIREQAAAIEVLSIPIIPISSDIGVMPIIGSVNRRRAEQMQQALCQWVAASQARVLILDLTGVSSVSAENAVAFVDTARAVRLLGARLIITGMRPDVASFYVRAGIDFGDIAVFGTLERGILEAMRKR